MIIQLRGTSVEEFTTGVYCWRNRVNGKRYVGSAAVSLLKRMREHKCALTLGTSHNPYLQQAWNKYGPKGFVFCILERCLPEDCIVREQFWIDHYRVSDRRCGYNLCPIAGSNRGIVYSKEVRLKKSKIVKAKLLQNPDYMRPAIEASKSLEARANRSKGLQGKCVKTPEHRAKLSKAGIGRKVPAEIVEKTASKLRGKKRSDEIRNKLSKALKGNSNGRGRKGRKYGLNLKYQSDPEAIARKRASALRSWELRRAARCL